VGTFGIAASGLEEEAGEFAIDKERAVTDNCPYRFLPFDHSFGTGKKFSASWAVPSGPHIKPCYWTTNPQAT
jgi:hypothetical protein